MYECLRNSFSYLFYFLFFYLSDFASQEKFAFCDFPIFRRASKGKNRLKLTFIIPKTKHIYNYNRCIQLMIEAVVKFLIFYKMAAFKKFRFFLNFFKNLKLKYNFIIFVLPLFLYLLILCFSFLFFLYVSTLIILSIIFSFFPFFFLLLIVSSFTFRL